MTEGLPEGYKVAVDDVFNRVEVDVDVLNYAFSDLILRMRADDKYKLRMKLRDAKKEISARKLRSAVNRTFEGHEGELRKVYHERTYGPQRLVAQCLFLTLPSIQKTGVRYTNNVKREMGVASISKMTGVARQDISNNIKKFENEHNGRIVLNKSSFLKLTKVKVSGKGRYAHLMNLFEDINLEEVSPECIIVFGPEKLNGFLGEDFEHEMKNIAEFRKSGGSVFVRAMRLAHTIEVYKVVRSHIFLRKYFVDEHQAVLVHSDQRVDSMSLDV